MTPDHLDALEARAQHDGRGLTRGMCCDLCAALREAWAERDALEAQVLDLRLKVTYWRDTAHAMQRARDAAQAKLPDANRRDRRDHPPMIGREHG